MSKRTAITVILFVLVGTVIGLGDAGYRENGFLPPAALAAEPGKILYYRNPMGLPDTSPTPKKDSMGMDYIPVYEGEETGTDQVRISPEKVQKLGVRTEAAQRRALSRPVRAVGLIAPDERRLFAVTPRYEG